MDNLPGLITACVALIAALGAIVQNRAGRRDTARQAQAARELEKREQAFSESEAALIAHKELGVTYREEIARVNAERDREAERYAASLARKDDVIKLRAQELLETRAECSKARGELAEMVAILSATLRAEIHAESVRMALDAHAEHGTSTDPHH